MITLEEIQSHFPENKLELVDREDKITQIYVDGKPVKVKWLTQETVNTLAVIHGESIVDELKWSMINEVKFAINVDTLGLEQALAIKYPGAEF